MHEQEKLLEAKYFAEHMEASVDDPQAFHFPYEWSAFLSAARSVLQYALDEARQKDEAQQKSNGQSWYESRVSNNALLGFFKCKRDVNIHREPVRPLKDISVFDTLRIGIEDGTTEMPKPIETSPPAEFRYRLEDSPGSEDVLELSQQYLAALDRFVRDGIEGGYISG